MSIFIHIFLIFPKCLLSVPRPRPRYHFIFNCHVSSGFLSCENFLDCYYFQWPFWFCRKPLKWDLSDFFLMSFKTDWSIIILQCGISFCFTTMWLGYTPTYIPSLLISDSDLTLLGHHRALSWTSCAIQQLPISSQFHTY